MPSPKQLVAGIGVVFTIGAPAIALAASAPPTVDDLSKTAPFQTDNALQEKMRAVAHRELVRQTAGLARTLAKLQGRELRHGYRHAISGWSNERLLNKERSLRRQINALQARSSAASTVSIPAILQRIAQCESGGNPRAIGGGGAYRGKYQFDYGTWASVGGHGDPAAAPEAEQDRRAMMLYQRSGTAPWPVCGR
jgi:hypothetical protein